MINVAIAGAGSAGKKLLTLFADRTEVDVLAVFDQDPNAPALPLAWDRDIPFARSIEELICSGADVFLNVTGDPEITKELMARVPPHARVLDGAAVNLILTLTDIQTASQELLRQSLRDQQILYLTGLNLTSAESLEQVLEQILNRATALTHTPAGSIALYDEETDAFRMAISQGLSDDFLRKARGAVRRGGLNDQILQSTKPVVVSDIRRQPGFDNPALNREGIRSVLACTLRGGRGPVGILYVDDFEPRDFSKRHVSLISLFSSQAAMAIEKFRLIDRIRDTVRYLEGILDYSGDMIMTTDTEGRIVRFNRGGEELLGYTQDEIIGRPAREIYRDPSERDKIAEELKTSGVVLNREVVLIRKDGSAVDISLTLSVLKDHDGRSIGTVGISKDVTREKMLRKALEERNQELNILNDRLEEKVSERTRELEKINEELERANRLKSQFIANMSHELRTPLNSIIGFSDILSEQSYGTLNDKQNRYVENIASSGRHLLQLVNNILDLAKIEAGRIDLIPDRFDLSEVVEEVACAMRAISEKKSVNIELSIAPDLPPVSADRVKMKQVFYNLMANAVKFTDEGGRVIVRTGLTSNGNGDVPDAPADAEFFTVAVTDTGVGIHPDETERIFNEFEQADATFSRNFEGAGLGLSLSRRLVEIHGGRITVASTPGRGSTFTVYIPREARPAVSPAAETTIGAAEPVHDEKSPPLAPLILVVEDDFPTSEILTIHLSEAGFRVGHAVDGDEAIRKAVELSPALIILDVMTPRRDGWEVLQTLKNREDTKAIPIIVHAVVDNREQAFSLGAADYLPKPLEKGTLLEKVTDIVGVGAAGAGSSTVLLVSNDREFTDRIANEAPAVGLSVETSVAAGDIFERLRSRSPAVLVADADLLAEGPAGVLRPIKEHPNIRTMPIFVVAGDTLPLQDRVGLSSFVERLIPKAEFSAKTLRRELAELERAGSRHSGLIDPATGIFNHRYFDIRLEQELGRAERYGDPLALIFIAMDESERFRELKGDYYAQAAFEKITELIRKHIRGSDIFARYRRDTLAVLLPNTNLADAHTLAGRFVDLVETYPFLFEDVQEKRTITASAGLSVYRAPMTSADIVRTASEALAHARTLGGNRVEVKESPS